MPEDKGKGSGPPQRHGHAAAPDWWNSLARVDLPDDPNEPIQLPKRRKVRKIRKMARRRLHVRAGTATKFVLLVALLVLVSVAALLLPPSISMTVGVLAVLSVLVGTGVLMDRHGGSRPNSKNRDRG